MTRDAATGSQSPHRQSSMQLSSEPQEVEILSVDDDPVNQMVGTNRRPIAVRHVRVRATVVVRQVVGARRGRESYVCERAWAFAIGRCARECENHSLLNQFEDTRITRC
eukprot:672303-Rhodomonas_salina.3